jgi:hypothetical protein
MLTMSMARSNVPSVNCGQRERRGILTAKVPSPNHLENPAMLAEITRFEGLLQNARIKPTSVDLLGQRVANDHVAR